VFFIFWRGTTAHTILNLLISDSPFDVFNPHPMNPIVVSPRFARMGGKILNFQGKTIRFGQNNSGEYGESLAVLNITKLSEESYNEEMLGTIAIDNFSGPHSIDFNTNMSQILIDYYRNKFSLLAGMRRIRSRLHKK